MKLFKKMISVNKLSNKACEMSAYKILTACLFFLAAALPMVANAQVQRSFVNPSFELPALATTCNVQIPAASVPGWETTSATAFPVFACGLTGLPANSAGLIELWANNFNGVASFAGTSHAELNAEQASRLYQNMCILNGETLTYSFAHRGRTGTDVARFGLNATGSTATPVTTVIATATTASTAWQVYNGTYVSTLPTGLYQVGFASVSTGSGNATIGNFIDAAQISGRPVVEMAASGAGTTVGEGATTASGITPVVAAAPFPFGFRISGLLTAPLVVHLQVTGGTATYLTDYTLPNGTNADFTVTVPAGNYDGTTMIQIPITALSDALAEGGETVIVGLLADPNYNRASVATCGGAATPTATLTILNVVRPSLAVTKTVSQTPLVVGQTGQTYTITIAVANGPTTQAITIADALPTGITTSGAITATGGTLSGCPATGATNLSGCSIAAGAATGNIVITVPVSVAAAAVNPSINTATVTGGGDPTCTGIAPACTGTVSTPVISSASVVIAKTDNKSLATSGGTNAYIVTLANQGPSPADGVVVTDTVVSGLVCPAANAVVCSVTGAGAVCPAGPLTIGNLTGAGITVTILPAGGALQFAYTCNVN